MQSAFASRRQCCNCWYCIMFWSDFNIAMTCVSKPESQTYIIPWLWLYSCVKLL